MNDSYTLREAMMEPARPALAADTHESDMPATQRTQESGKISNAELAQKVMKLTGSVRLASRSAHNWHHCGINE